MTCCYSMRMVVCVSLIMSIRVMPAPAGLQPVQLELFASVLCFCGMWLGSCKEAWGDFVGSATFSRSVMAGVMVDCLLNDYYHDLLAICSCVLPEACS